MLNIRRIYLFVKPLYVLLILILNFSCNNNNPTNANEIVNQWIPINEGLLNKNVQTMAINPSDNNEIFLGTLQGLYKSSNGGKSWTYLDANLPNNDIKDIEFDFNNPNIIYIGTWGGGIFKTEDSGTTWITDNNGLSDPRVYSLLISDNKTNNIFAGTESGLFNRVDAGKNWIKTTSQGAPTTCISIPSIASATMYVGIKWKGVYKTIDGGLTWLQKNNGLYKDQSGVFVSPTEIQVDPNDNNTIYLGAGRLGVYFSLDAAENWFLKNAGLERKDVKCLTVNPVNSDELYVGTSQGVFQSLDAGDSWNEINNGLTSLDVRALAIDPKDPRVIYAGTMGGGVFKMFLD